MTMQKSHRCLNPSISQHQSHFTGACVFWGTNVCIQSGIAALLNTDWHQKITVSPAPHLVLYYIPSSSSLSWPEIRAVGEGTLLGSHTIHNHIDSKDIPRRPETLAEIRHLLRSLPNTMLSVCARVCVMHLLLKALTWHENIARQKYKIYSWTLKGWSCYTVIWIILALHPLSFLTSTDHYKSHFEKMFFFACKHHKV